MQPLTVTTYDSAFIHMEHLGARFGLIVFDECHHLPSSAYALAARASLAPFRLGLDGDSPSAPTVATPSSTTSSGPSSTAKTSWSCSGDYLAEYDVEHVSIEQVAS